MNKPRVYSTEESKVIAQHMGEIAATFYTAFCRNVGPRVVGSSSEFEEGAMELSKIWFQRFIDTDLRVRLTDDDEQIREIA